MKHKGLTVALLGKHFDWGGGAEFLRHVANGLLAIMAERHLKIHLLLPVVNKIETPADAFRVLERSLRGTIAQRRPWIARPKAEFHDSILDYFGHTLEDGIKTIYYGSSNAGLVRCLSHINADVVLPVNGSLGSDFPIPWIGYVSDFQHKHLPGNFDPLECFNREIGFATTLRDARAVIVNSRAVRDDILRFYPWIDANRILNLPFAPHPLPDWFDACAVSPKAKYQLPDRYFLISNQFWIHKDHLTALRALKRIADTCDVGVVCTGAMNDYRHPAYIEKLNSFINEASLANRVWFLGHIPKREQVEIMKGSLAVIQPTLFEGGPGGGSVYDAVALGVPIIASDIPVNTEVIAENIRFFEAANDESLAMKMMEVMGRPSPRPTQDQLLAMGKRNLSNLGNHLYEAIECVRKIPVTR